MPIPLVLVLATVRSVAVVAPLLLVLARTRAYTPVRLAVAAAAGVAALGWAAQRALGWGNPVEPWVERAAADALWLVVGLAALAGSAAVWERWHRLRARPSA